MTIVPVAPWIVVRHRGNGPYLLNSAVCVEIVDVGESVRPWAAKGALIAAFHGDLIRVHDEFLIIQEANVLGVVRE